MIYGSVLKWGYPFSAGCFHGQIRKETGWFGSTPILIWRFHEISKFRPISIEPNMVFGIGVPHFEKFRWEYIEISGDISLRFMEIWHDRIELRYDRMWQFHAVELYRYMVPKKMKAPELLFGNYHHTTGTSVLDTFFGIFPKYYYVGM